MSQSSLFSQFPSTSACSKRGAHASNVLAEAKQRVGEGSVTSSFHRHVYKAELTSSDSHLATAARSPAAPCESDAGHAARRRARRTRPALRSDTPPVRRPETIFARLVALLPVPNRDRVRLEVAPIRISRSFTCRAPARPRSDCAPGGRWPDCRPPAIARTPETRYERRVVLITTSTP